MHTTLSLLGSFEVTVGPEAEAAPPLERKTRAILAYLAATDRTHTRHALIDLFCQGANDPAGLLRWHLSRIRRQLHEDILIVTPQEVTFNRPVAETDLALFEQVLNNPDRFNTRMISSTIDLYRGPFLEDLTLPGAAEFELWLLGERTRIQQLYEKGMNILIGRHIEQQDYSAAIPRARQVLQANALLETVHTQLVWLYARTGRRESALKQYERCESLLQQELAVEPSAEIRTVYSSVLENRPLPPISVESDPVPQVVVAPPEKTRFVGRSAELEELHTLWRTIQNEGRMTVLVDAVAGGGKTRLVQEFLSRLPAPVQPLKGGCYESTHSIPYQPWLALLETRVQQLNAADLNHLSPAWQAQLARLLPQTFAAMAGVLEQQEHLFRAVADLLLGSGKTPCILLIEDLQWADEASLQLFLFLGRYVRREHRPALLIGTFRSEEVDDNPALQTFLSDALRSENVERLSLPPLAGDEITFLIGHLWAELPGESALREMRDRLLAETGGNPLFVSEILQEMAQRGELPAALPIPPSLQDLTNHRLGRLPDSSRQVLETLAVLDRPAHFDLAQQISGRSEDEIIAAIERGLRWRFLEPHPATRYDFSHDLIRSAVRSQMSDIRRRRLHHRAARTLTERGADAATLAYHWGQAGDQEKQVQYALLAGNEALNRAAFNDAVQLFQQSLEVLPAADKERRYRARLGLVKAWDALSEMAQIGNNLPSLVALAEETGHPAHRAEAALHQARFELNRGETAAAETITRRGIERAVEAQSRSLEAGLVEVLGDVYQTHGDFERAQRYAEKALELYTAEDDRRGRASVLKMMGNLARNQGQHRQAVEIHRRALALCRELADPLNESRVLARLADSLWHLGDYEAARTIAEEGLAVSREIGDRRAEAIQTNNLAGLAMAQEDHRTAIAYYREALAIVESLKDLQGAAVYQNNIGGAYIGLGDVDSALVYLEKAINTSREAGIPRTQAQAHHTRGRAYQLAGDHEAARVEFEQALVLRQELGQAYQTLLTLIQLVYSCTELAALEAAEMYRESAERLYISLKDQIPQYVHQMFHFTLYLHFLGQGDETAAAEHLHLAHKALQNRLAELDDDARAELAQSEDSQQILTAIDFQNLTTLKERT